MLNRWVFRQIKYLFSMWNWFLHPRCSLLVSGICFILLVGLVFFQFNFLIHTTLVLTSFILGFTGILLVQFMLLNIAKKVRKIAFQQGLPITEKFSKSRGLKYELGVLEQGLNETSEALKHKNTVLEDQRKELWRLAAFRENLAAFVSETLQQGLSSDFYKRLLECAVKVIPGSQAGSLLLREGKRYNYETVFGYELANFQGASISVDDIALVYSDNKPSHFSDFSLQTDFLENTSPKGIAGRQSAVRDSLGIPVLIDGFNVAFLTLDNFEKSNVFGIEAVSMAEVFAAQIGVVLKRLNLEKELQTRQAEIENKNVELERANKLKSDFLANMSHELRTPLTSIIGFAELLREELFGPLNEKQQQYVKDIFNSGNHLLLLINDILDLSKIEAGHVELVLGEHDVRELIQSVIHIMIERARKAAITLSTDIAEDVNLIYADGRKIKQVLFNLVANAVKFTAEGGDVEISVRKEEEMLEFNVKDTGIGIAQEDLAKLFKEFSQIDSSLTRRHKGTGLGLILSKRLVELHGGSIWIESQEGIGSTFTFYIPKHCELPTVSDLEKKF